MDTNKMRIMKHRINNGICKLYINDEYSIDWTPIQHVYKDELHATTKYINSNKPFFDYRYKKLLKYYYQDFINSTE